MSYKPAIETHIFIPHGKTKPQLALICHINDDKTVNLLTFEEDCSPVSYKNAVLVQAEGDVPCHYTDKAKPVKGSGIAEYDVVILYATDQNDILGSITAYQLVTVEAGADHIRDDYNQGTQFIAGIGPAYVSPSGPIPPSSLPGPPDQVNQSPVVMPTGIVVGGTTVPWWWSGGLQGVPNTNPPQFIAYPPGAGAGSPYYY